ncbi:MAG: hypothetical protein AAGM84_14305 [Pseudomonadota bacterium]
MKLDEVSEVITQFEQRLRAATSQELIRELRFALAHFRTLRDDRIRSLLFDEALG